ncbi:hypothetical protein [Streptomyces flavofungini]|uniref:hypothetical protein n=1 Tax=Streptomyces flavofungini TaxID=68200 RepID=UPI0025B18B60|nr:hypothetical protein [Streptomyces flavofungini]WJV46726.1 hypothetical protein QUY26_15055 [Streptomyces flavofungini]
MKSAVSRVVAAVSVAAALGLTAACGGGDGDKGDGRDGGKSSTSQAKPKGPGGGSDGAGADGGSADRSPEAKKLKAKVLAADDLKRPALKRYEVTPRERSKLEAASDGAAATPAACRPLSDMTAAATPPKAQAHAGRTVAPKRVRDDLVATDVELFAYDSQNSARKALREVRAAAKAKECGAFRAGGVRYSGVTPESAPDKGDESVAYRIGSREEQFVKRHAVVVVRDGSTLVSFVARNYYDPEAVAGEEESREGGGGSDLPGPDKADEAPEVPAAVVDAQLDKVG